ncbi:MAG: ATP synthase F1 subunit delta, partial [Dehalococcoidia bacterium]|nr:ATP synthase F1 subunit delta [Dehalococcoidia bacterium]
ALAAGLEQDDLRAALESVRMPFDVKTMIIQQVFPDVDPLARNFLALLVQRNRLGILPEIIDLYAAMLDDERGIARASVTTAVELAPDEAQQVARRLEELTGKTIRLETSVDPAILGGVIVRIGDKLIDGSTRTRLNMLRQRLAG